MIHPTAIVSRKAELGSDVTVDAYCTIEDGVIIGDGTVVFSILSAPSMGSTVLIF